MLSGSEANAAVHCSVLDPGGAPQHFRLVLSKAVACTKDDDLRQE